MEHCPVIHVATHIKTDIQVFNVIFEIYVKFLILPVILICVNFVFSELNPTHFIGAGGGEHKSIHVDFAYNPPKLMIYINYEQFSDSKKNSLEENSPLNYCMNTTSL